MTNREDVLLREVDEELSQDRQLAFFRRYGPLLVGLALALVALVAALQVVESRREAARREAAAAYMAVAREGASADALLQFASVAEGGYRQLALLRAGAALGQAGDRRAAIDAYAEVYGDEDTPAALADLARMRAAYLAVEDVTPGGGAQAVDQILQGVTTEAFAPFAREVAALSAMRRGDYAGAAAGFEEAASAEGAPSTLTLRASQLAALARSGAAGVPLEAGEPEDDLVEAFGRRMQEAARAQVAPSAAEEAPVAPDPAPNE